MPEAAFLDASGKFIDAGILGALVVILMSVIILQYRAHRVDMKEKEAAHQKTREAHLADIRAFATIGESIREQQRATEAAITTVLDLVKERDQR